jgi:Family of unknown function (DUF6338)
MSWGDALQFIAVIGPGFVLLKVLYLFGGQHRRLEWEWVVWSVLIGLVLTALGAALVALFSFIEGPVPRDAVLVLTSFGLAVVCGAGLAYLWERVKQSRNPAARRLHRWISDSAWDFVLDEANRRDNGVEVITEVDGKEAGYYGTLDTFGQEVAQAEPWIYLTFVYQWDPDRGYLPMSNRTEGMLFHRSQIKRLRFIAQDKPQETAVPVITGAMTAQAGAVIARPQDAADE